MWIFDEAARNKIFKSGIFPKPGSSGSDAKRHTEENGALENFISTTTDIETAKYFGARNEKAQNAIEAKKKGQTYAVVHIIAQNGVDADASSRKYGLNGPEQYEIAIYQHIFADKIQGIEVVLNDVRTWYPNTNFRALSANQRRKTTSG